MLNLRKRPTTIVECAPPTLRALDAAVRARLTVLWQSGTERSRAETAGFLLAEIDKTLQAWIEEA